MACTASPVARGIRRPQMLRNVFGEMGCFRCLVQQNTWSANMRIPAGGCVSGGVWIASTSSSAKQRAGFGGLERVRHAELKRRWSARRSLVTGRRSLARRRSHNCSIWRCDHREFRSPGSGKQRPARAGCQCFRVDCDMAWAPADWTLRARSLADCVCERCARQRARRSWREG